MTGKNIARRTALLAAAGGLAGLGGHAALAQPAVSGVARTIVGFPPGGSSDTVARLYAERLRGSFAQQVIVENRAGAGGRVAIDAVKTARPDGTSLLQTPASMLTIYPHIYPRTARYDALTDLTPVSTICTFPFALLVRPDHPAKTFPELVAWAKAQPAEIPFGSPAAGAVPHFLGVQMAKALGLKLTHVPYRGGAPALQDLLAGQIPFAILVLGEVTEFHKSGQVRILALSSPERLPRFPDLPTFAELGQPTLTAEEWFRMLLPPQAPSQIVDALHQAIVAAAATPEMQEALARLEYRAVTSRSPAEFAARIRDERAHWAPIVQESGFKGEE